LEGSKVINRIRVATPEEVKSIAEFSDCQVGASVLALDTPEGTAFAVVRTVVEVDPVIYPEKLSSRMKAVFQRDIETVLAAQGILKYYFNVHVSNEQMLEVLKNFGAVQQSTEPELRFFKVL
jgi:hypothetical protein